MESRKPFPIENRISNNNIQEFNALSDYLKQWQPDELLLVRTIMNASHKIYRILLFKNNLGEIIIKTNNNDTFYFFFQSFTDFHFLIYLTRLDMVPMKPIMGELLQCVSRKDVEQLKKWKLHEAWTTLESLVFVSSNMLGYVRIIWKAFQSSYFRIGAKIMYECTTTKASKLTLIQFAMCHPSYNLSRNNYLCEHIIEYSLLWIEFRRIYRQCSCTAVFWRCSHILYWRQVRPLWRPVQYLYLRFSEVFLKLFEHWKTISSPISCVSPVWWHLRAAMQTSASKVTFFPTE